MIRSSSELEGFRSPTSLRSQGSGCVDLNLSLHSRDRANYVTLGDNTDRVMMIIDYW